MEWTFTMHNIIILLCIMFLIVHSIQSDAHTSKINMRFDMALQNMHSIFWLLGNSNKKASLPALQCIQLIRLHFLPKFTLYTLRLFCCKTISTVYNFAWRHKQLWRAFFSLQMFYYLKRLVAWCTYKKCFWLSSHFNIWCLNMYAM